MEISFVYDGRYFASKKFSSVKVDTELGNSWLPVVLADHLKSYLNENGIENALRAHSADCLIESKRHENGVEVYANNPSYNIEILFKDSRGIVFYDTHLETNQYLNMYKFVFVQKDRFKGALNHLSEIIESELQNEVNFQDRFLTA